MKQRVLVVTGAAGLESELCSRLHDLQVPVEVLVAGSTREALATLETSEVDQLVVHTPDAGYDLLSLLWRAFEPQPHLGVQVLAPALPEAPPQAFGLRQIRYAVWPPDHGLSSSVPFELIAAPKHEQATPRAALDLVDIALIMLISSRSAMVRVGWSGETGLLGFAAGQLVHASTGSLGGPDAFYAMALWDGWEPHPVGDTDLARTDNVFTTTTELVSEALRLRRAIEDWSEWVESDLDRLDPEQATTGLVGWWRRVLAHGNRGARVVVAHDEGSTCLCAQTISSGFGAAVEVDREWIDPGGAGPTFVRIHPRGGGLLNLISLPMTPENRYQFEAFARRAEAVIVCCRDCQASDEWLASVSDRDSLVIVRPTADDGTGHQCRALERLAERL